jgi:hypothetical protein
LIATVVVGSVLGAAATAFYYIETQGFVFVWECDIWIWICKWLCATLIVMKLMIGSNQIQM